MYLYRENFTDDDMTNEHGRFIDNPRISDIVGQGVSCIMGFNHTDINWHAEEVTREVKSDSAGYLLPEDWQDEEWWLTDFEFICHASVAESLTPEEIEEVEGWGLAKEKLESLMNPETRGDLILLRVEDRASSSYDYDYNSYEYKFFVPEDWE